MKKIILFLYFSIFSVFLYADWENICIVDEFHEPTGKIMMGVYDKEKKDFIRIGASNDTQLCVEFRPESKIYDTLEKINPYTKKYEKIKPMSMKVDKNSHVNVICDISYDQRWMYFYIDRDSEFVEQLKKGKILKIVITNFRESRYIEFSLDGFIKCLSKLK